MEIRPGSQIDPYRLQQYATTTVKISVIVPTCNRKDVLIGRTLPALFDQDAAADEFEVIVIVDGATDGTIEALREQQQTRSFVVLEQANRGPGAARNLGLQYARGALVLFIDDDIICSPSVLREHMKAHASSGPAVVYGNISIAPETPSSILKVASENWYTDYYRQIEAHCGLNLPKDNFLISNSSMPRTVLMECGGFDETLTAKEDYDLGLRLWKQGVRFLYVPQATAYEFFHKPIQYVLHKDGKGFGETDILLARKHPDYRPYSGFAQMGMTASWKRMLRHGLTVFPLNFAIVLNPLLGMCEKLCRFSLFQRLGQYILGAGRRVTEYRAAARQAGSWQVLESEFGHRLPVLLYHHVGPEYPGSVVGLTVSPENFERHVRWLAKRGYVGVCPAEWLQWCREGKGLPSKPVLLTFDDGYEDLVKHAFPVLKKYGFGAAVFIVTGQLGGINSWDTVRGFTPLPLMTADQIRYWAEHGIEFGAHSRSHADLSKLPAEQLNNEVTGSAEDLERLLETRVISFAYPYGYKSPQAVETVRETFDIAFGIDPGEPGINNLLTDCHLLRRSMVQPADSAIEVELRVRFGYNPIDKLRARFRLRSRLRRLVDAVFGK